MARLFIDLLGTELSAEEKELLVHPNVAGVILFTRNYDERAQLIELVASIRRACPRPLLISVDHEGGRVQRFRHQFTELPAMGDIASLAKQQGCSAELLAQQLGWLMAAELRACDIDLSFAPVLDLNGNSEVIGLRAFASEPEPVITLASRFIKGMQQAGMKSCGKHFPGHGSVVADTHHHVAVDEREATVIRQRDMQCFSQLIAKSHLDAIMPAHVIYSQVDPNPAGFSPYWLQTVLRQELGFKGLIFSDDLSMEGAAQGLTYPERAEQALAAGCDLLLACNNRAASIALIETLKQEKQTLIEPLMGNAFSESWKELERNPNRIKLKNHLAKWANKW